MFEITKGKIKKPLRVVVYGTEGIGKSTFASQFPSPVFIDTEGSTNHLNVARFPAPTSWEMLLQEVDQIINNPQGFQTLVIDTADWAQNLCIQSVCAKRKVNGIEDFGYGQGYTYVKEEFGKLLNRLNDAVEKGLNVVMTAHSIINKFTKPDEMGQYDRYELKLINSPKCSVSALVKEWSDILLFANYETYLMEDSKTKKKYASGNKRVMYTTHTATWDAKNRFGMPDKLPFEFAEIAQLFEEKQAKNEQIEPIPTAPQPQPQAPVEAPIDITTVYQPSPYTAEEESVMTKLPKALVDMMRADTVKPSEIEYVATEVNGHWPKGMSMADYDPNYFSQFIIPNWTKVMEEITVLRKLPY